MAERNCACCGRRFFQRTGGHRFCSTVCREKSKSRLAGEAKYGFGHQNRRGQFLPFVRSGACVCVLCDEFIEADADWDLHHAEDGLSYPTHRYCNRADGARVSNRKYVDDPREGVFWGPGPTAGGLPTRWSKVWFEWRDREEFRGYVGSNLAA